MIDGIVILISGRGSNMQAILTQVKSGAIPAPVSAVISNQPDASGLAIARAEKIPTQTISHREFETREAFDTALIQAIDQYSPKLVVLAGFMRILTDGFIDHYKGRLINIHPSLLPAFPGLNTHQRAIDAGVKHHGATVHFVTRDVDSGPIIAQAQVSVRADDTPISLGERVLKEEHRILPMAVKWYMENRLSVRNGRVLLDNIESVAQGLVCQQQ